MSTAITSEHSFARIAQVLDDIESLRLELGRARDARVPMHVHDASPREVFYHATTVHRKANQLCVELGATPVAAPEAAQPGRAQPADVLRVLDSTRERLAVARLQLHIEGDSYHPELPGPLEPMPGKLASDVLAGCLLASRQLNAMLPHPFSSAESHELLLRALGITERLLAVHGRKLPEAPAFERRKAPREVFQQLWLCCEVLRKLLADSGVRSLGIERGYVGELPTDVYDVGSLIMSELEFLATFLAGDPPRPLVAPVPVTVLPAHNYRRARQLQAGLDLLARCVSERPDWLRNPAAPESRKPA